MITADKFTDKNGNTIALEDEIVYHDKTFVVVGINLYNDTLTIKRVDNGIEYAPMTIRRKIAKMNNSIEIKSIP